MFVVALLANDKNVVRVGVGKMTANEDELTKLMVPLTATPGCCPV